MKKVKAQQFALWMQLCNTRKQRGCAKHAFIYRHKLIPCTNTIEYHEWNRS